MNTMLILIFASVLFGLAPRRMSSPETVIAIVLASALTIYYFIRPMSMT